MESVVLDVQNLRTYFYTRRGVAKAVDDVSFQVCRGEVLGLVGESGCGKSTVGLSIMRLVPQPAGRIVSGQIFLDGHDLLRISDKEMKKYRGPAISMILQDPMSSLNPVYSVGNQVGEAIRIHQRLKGARLWQKVLEMLSRVQIPSPEIRAKNYPHELSGGMRQRVVGGIAISCEPRLIIADEPTTSLDLTIQAQYLNFLKNIQEESGLSLIFITHDLGIIAKMCDRVFVMYAGKIVETAPVRDLFNCPAHPYTEALLESRPKLGQEQQKVSFIKGHPPSLLNLPNGCAFVPRCTEMGKLCQQKETPPLEQVSNGHLVRCWHRGC